ncbi:MAG: TonB-dependent receptor [Verrucomicrobiales bacterium]|nr:TonB-dependent receptor [Verrucomicrobiales bacterium]
MYIKRKLLAFVLGIGLSGASGFTQEAESLETTVVETPPAAPAVPAPTPVQRPAAPAPPLATTVVNPPEVATTVATKAAKIEVDSVDTIAVSELRQYQRFSVNDTLRQMAGTTIVQNGGPGTLTGFNIRGMQSDQNVVLLNGRRLPPGLAGQYQLEFLEVSTLESVQVLKGAAGSLYGADAIGGVIDLKSTDARFVETNGISMYSEAGSFTTFRNGGIASFREGRVGAVIEAATISTNGDRPNSEFENGTLRGDIAFDVADGIWFDVLGFVQAGEVMVPGSDFQNPNFPAKQENLNDSYLISPRLTIERDNWDASVFYSYNQNDLENINTPQFFGFGTNGSLRQIGRETEALFNYTAIDNATLSVGGGNYEYYFLQKPIGTNSFVANESHQYSYSSVFGQADVDLPAGFNVIGSVRNDNHDTYADATTYSVGVSKDFEATGTRIFAKTATGYRAPTGQDLLFIVDPSGISPADIKPEESESWEVGIRQDFFDETASLTVTYFENEFINSIEFDPVTFGLSTVDGQTKGFEVEGALSPRDGIDFYANYTYLDTTVIGGAGNLSGNPGDRLARRPRHTFNSGVVFGGDHWDLGTEIHSSFDRYDRATAPSFVDDYISTRVFGSFDLTDKLELYGRVENLFDEEYLYTRGYKAPGFGAFGGVRITFGD